MELKEFIKGTLLSIVNGVESANTIKKNRFKIAGHASPVHHASGGTYVEFDVAVVASESKETGSKSGIMVALGNIVGGAGKQKKLSQTDENISRLKFKIFVTVN